MCIGDAGRQPLGGDLPAFGDRLPDDVGHVQGGVEHHAVGRQGVELDDLLLLSGVVVGDDAGRFTKAEQGSARLQEVLEASRRRPRHPNHAAGRGTGQTTCHPSERIRHGDFDREPADRRQARSRGRADEPGGDYPPRSPPLPDLPATPTTHRSPGRLPAQLQPLPRPHRVQQEEILARWRQKVNLEVLTLMTLLTLMQRARGYGFRSLLG